MKVEFHPEAVEEFNEARAWYRERSPVAAASLSHELDRAIRRIAQSPERYPEDDRANRRLLLKRFPFTLIFRKMRDSIVVIALAHQKRRPRYWVNRTTGR